MARPPLLCEEGNIPTQLLANSLTRYMTNGDVASCWTVGGHKPPLQLFCRLCEMIISGDCWWRMIPSTLKEAANAVHSSRQWRPVFGGRRTGDPVVVGAPRFDRSHGHKIRVRYRPVRRLHGVDGWRCSQILFYAGRPGRGQKDHHHRRTVFRWVTPGAARVEGV